MVVNSLTDFTLRDYQIEGITTLRKSKRILLTDVPGLGKTAQAAFASTPPVLVVCPGYLVSLWAEKLAEYGFDKVAVAIGNRQERNAALNDMEAFFVVCNIEMLDTYHQFADKVWLRHWRSIIFDESHHLKSHNGKRAKIAVTLARHAEYVYLLTATPVKREIDDYFMQFRILQPDIFTSYWRFVNQFCNTEQTYFGTKILGAKKSMIPELKQVLSVITFGRTYEEVGRQVPPVIEKFIHVQMNEKTQQLYNEVVNYWRVEDEEERLTFTNYMSLKHILRQHLTGALKAPTVRDIVEDDGRQSAIFSWYRNTAEAIQQAIGDNCVLLHGEMQSEERRQRAILAMEQGKHISATIMSLGEGVDLSRCRNLIFAEEDSTPGSNFQALSRVRRERQDESNDEPVVIYYVHVPRTIDEEIHAVANGRSMTVKQLVKNALYL